MPVRLRPDDNRQELPEPRHTQPQLVLGADRCEPEDGCQKLSLYDQSQSLWRCQVSVNQNLHPRLLELKSILDRLALNFKIDAHCPTMVLLNSRYYV